MTIDEAIQDWKSHNRRMGCVSASKWFCKRVEGFVPLQQDRYTTDGEFYSHTVAWDGRVIVDLSPYADRPSDHECVA